MELSHQPPDLVKLRTPTEGEINVICSSCSSCRRRVSKSDLGVIDSLAMNVLMRNNFMARCFKSNLPHGTKDCALALTIDTGIIHPQFNNELRQHKIASCAKGRDKHTALSRVVKKFTISSVTMVVSTTGIKLLKIEGITVDNPDNFLIPTCGVHEVQSIVPFRILVGS